MSDSSLSRALQSDAMPAKIMLEALSSQALLYTTTTLLLEV